jgi:signal transduction histidine kinase
MVNSYLPASQADDASPGYLLKPEEIVVIVDDSPEISLLLQTFLNNKNIATASANNVDELTLILAEKPVALVILDIGLPGRNGDDILPDLVNSYPDLGILMVTGNTDLQTALDCLRAGADDYLTKPVNIEQFYHTVLQTLKKRKLAIDNRAFQKELQLTNLRTQFLHYLNLEMNSAYLSAGELARVLQTILIGITSHEGLRFNRAFLALFNEQQTLLEGVLAIGPGSREEATAIWEEIKQKNLKLQDHFRKISSEDINSDDAVNRIARSLSVPASAEQHPLIYACRTISPILVNRGQAEIPIPEALIELLGEDSFVIVPLFSPSRALGVIIADNYITRQPIDSADVEALEIFAGQASLAIEHSRLYTDMQVKIDMLESLTRELEKSQDLLVEAERFTALGQMSAQLVHALRNPVTAIGGTARLLNRRITAGEDQKFLNLLVKESAKLESTINDLFNFVSDAKPDKKLQPLFPLVRRALLAFHGIIEKNHIGTKIALDGDGPLLLIDSEQISQVFLQLIRNGLDSMSGGGTLSISAEQNDDSVTITIGDTGTGMINGDLSRVTDPFYTTKTYGTGMGLTLVEQILSQHQAGFSLKSNQDQGMVATVTFFWENETHHHPSAALAENNQGG